MQIITISIVAALYTSIPVQCEEENHRTSSGLRRNILATQNDIFHFGQSIEDVIANTPDQDTATVSKNIIRAVSHQSPNMLVLSRAQAVVDAARGDRSMLRDRIMDLLTAVMTKEGNDDKVGV
ncbi:unnamed protein product [Albugo candida]|uniref:RxLR effector protein n=1 Tax=Albugo candida TaxID=65357 RepID=A0A024G6D6_9STRA|nr:unnamed protein product [Albugo candida]|eukprot:CCI41870.1 unnamed protein product [Albugo candida]